MVRARVPGWRESRCGDVWQWWPPIYDPDDDRTISVDGRERSFPNPLPQWGVRYGPTLVYRCSGTVAQVYLPEVVDFDTMRRAIAGAEVLGALPAATPKETPDAR
jgi:hypothetical protein